MRDRDFSPTTDEEVIVLLDAAARRLAQARPLVSLDADEDVSIPAGQVALSGHLHLPQPASGLVLFAHGSGSSRFSPRNRFVASVLYDTRLSLRLARARAASSCCLLLRACSAACTRRVLAWSASASSCAIS